MNNLLQSIKQTVQKNCHISDARHASDYTLCIYLLKMREYYRWEKSLGYSDELNSDDVGSWLTERENLWEELGEEDYLSIETSENKFQCFDASNINQDLLKQGFIYSAGYGPKSKPIFYLAELKQQIIQDEYNIYISGQEHARDLTAPVAMSQQNNIFIRRESLHRMIWEKKVEWGWHQNKNAMFKAMSFYDFNESPETALEAMTTKELNSVILHEIGEIDTANKLTSWQQMLVDLPRSQAEIMCRAIKDLLADTTSTLPTLINNREDSSIHFYFANFTHMRKELSPALLKAYQQWDDTHDYNGLLKAVNQAAQYWMDIAQDILDIYEHHPQQYSTHIESLVKDNQLQAL